MWTVLAETTANLPIWAEYGLAGLVVGFTLWRDVRREIRQAKENRLQQQWIQETLVGVINRNTEAQERCAQYHGLRSKV